MMKKMNCLVCAVLIIQFGNKERKKKVERRKERTIMLKKKERKKERKKILILVKKKKQGTKERKKKGKNDIEATVKEKGKKKSKRLRKKERKKEREKRFQCKSLRLVKKCLKIEKVDKNWKQNQEKLTIIKNRKRMKYEWQ